MSSYEEVESIKPKTMKWRRGALKKLFMDISLYKTLIFTGQTRPNELLISMEPRQKLYFHLSSTLSSNANPSTNAE